MNWTAFVLQQWKDEGVPLNTPASTDELLQLASVLEGSVPPDLEALYRVANGMVDNAMDRWHVSFWSIARILRERDIAQENERRWMAFADFLVDSWVFRICAQGDRTLVMVESTREVFDDLPDFFNAYANRPGSLDLVRISQ